MQAKGWTKVVPKRPNIRWDVFPFGGRNRDVGTSPVTSFYVSEFPDYFNAKRLFELFGCSGSVVEVEISPRRNRIGKRFAFARFSGVEDGRILAIRLDNILIEGKKIHVNLPRFSRDQGTAGGRKIIAVSKGLVKNSKAVSAADTGNGTGVTRGGSSSYAEAVGFNGLASVDNKDDSTVLNFCSNQALKSRFEKAYIGRVCILGSAYNIQNYLEMEGIYAIKVTPLGGNCCLLEDKEVGFIGDLIKEGETWWKSWFFEIKRWETGMVDGRRDAWFRIYGIPIHVWSTEFFMLLGEKWGRFIFLDENTAKGEAFDVARMLINIPLSLRIPDSVSVRIDGVVVKLCIREDAQSIYRQVANNLNVVSTDEGSFESEPDGLMLESDSVSSGGFEESVDREFLNSVSVCSDKKEDALSKPFCVNQSGGASEVGNSGRAEGHFEGISAGNFIGSKFVHPYIEYGAKAYEISETHAVQLLDNRTCCDTFSSNLKVTESESNNVSSDNIVDLCSAVAAEAVLCPKLAHLLSTDAGARKAIVYRKSEDDIRKTRRRSLVSERCKFLTRSTVSCPCVCFSKVDFGTGDVICHGKSMNSSKWSPHSGSSSLGSVGVTEKIVSKDYGSDGNGIDAIKIKATEAFHSVHCAGTEKEVLGGGKKSGKLF